jgi:hypothetical protein
MNKKDQDNLVKLYIEGRKSYWNDGDGGSVDAPDFDEGDYAEYGTQSGIETKKSLEDVVLDKVLDSIQYWKNNGEGLNSVIADMEVALMNLKRS